VKGKVHEKLPERLNYAFKDSVIVLTLLRWLQKQTLFQLYKRALKI